MSSRPDPETTARSPGTGGSVAIHLPLEAPDDLEILRGALLAARATELGQRRRRDARLSFGYGSDSARESMTAEVDHAERRWTLLDRLIAALDAAARDRRPG